MKEYKTIEATILYGGSFDPVQNAHVEILKELSERFEKVVAVPAGVSPF